MYARMTIIKNIDHQTYCANHIMMDVNQRIQCHRSILSPKYWKNKKIKFRKHLFFSLGGKKRCHQMLVRLWNKLEFSCKLSVGM